MNDQLFVAMLVLVPIILSVGYMAGLIKGSESCTTHQLHSPIWKSDGGRVEPVRTEWKIN